MTCSALRRSYRDLLRRSAPGVFFLHLHGSAELIGKRIRERRGHFMPPQLLDSQFATLEPLAPDEAGAVLDVSASPEDLIAEAVRIVTGLRNAQA